MNYYFDYNVCIYPFPNINGEILGVDKYFTGHVIVQPFLGFKSSPANKWGHRKLHLLNSRMIRVIIGSGNGLLSDGIKPLHEPVLTYHQ